MPAVTAPPRRSCPIQTHRRQPSAADSSAVATVTASFALDVTDIGRNIVRLEGTARRAHDQPPANEHPAYLAKYTQRMAALFSTSEQFAVVAQPGRHPGAGLRHTVGYAQKRMICVPGPKPPVQGSTANIRQACLDNEMM